MAAGRFGPARFRVETGPAGEHLVIPAPRNPLILLFLSVWLAGWTIVGAFAAAVFAGEPGFGMGLWLAVWALVWAGGVWLWGWMVSGREILRFVEGDLEIARRILGLSRRRRFRADEVRDLAVTVDARWSRIPPQRSLICSAEFRYGSRRVTFAPGMDWADAMAIITWLRKRLPPGGSGESEGRDEF